jgi:hypothetical protein
MGRRTAVALFAALALLAAPGAVASVSHHPERDDHPSARVSSVDRHATVAHVAARGSSSRERRASHDPSSWSAVLAATSASAPAAVWAHPSTVSTSSTSGVAASARPRAPPAVV